LLIYPQGWLPPASPLCDSFLPTASLPFLWPMEHPSAADWAIWQSTLSQVFCSSGLHLLSPLGSWTKSPHCSCSFMKYNTTLDILFLPGNAGTWCSYHQHFPPLLATHLWVGYAPASVPPFPPPPAVTHWMLADHTSLGPLFCFGSAPAAPNPPMV